jgi:hypothetical protein
LAQMGSDYFSLVNPYYSAPVIPFETGYHMYSYSLDFISLDPMGSTNYGKLTNVSIIPEASEQAQIANSITNQWGTCGSSTDCFDCCKTPQPCKYKECPANSCGSTCPAKCTEQNCVNRCAGLATKQTFEFICTAVY